MQIKLGLSFGQLFIHDILVMDNGVILIKSLLHKRKFVIICNVNSMLTYSFISLIILNVNLIKTYLLILCFCLNFD